MYQQLITPNLTVVGSLGYCLRYADQVFGVNSGEATAWQAWLDTQFKHLDQNFPPNSFPLWFSGAGGAGHVAIHTPNGIYSSPYNANQTHAVLSSIAQVEQLYGVTYVGWSEDITKLRVIKGGTMITKEDENVMSILATGSYPGADYNYQFVGTSNIDGMVNFWLSESQAVGLISKANQPAPGATVLSPGLYEVK